MLNSLKAPGPARKKWFWFAPSGGERLTVREMIQSDVGVQEDFIGRAQCGALVEIRRKLTAPRNASVTGVFPARLSTQLRAKTRSWCATTSGTVVWRAFASSSASWRTSESRWIVNVALMPASYRNCIHATSL